MGGYRFRSPVGPGIPAIATGRPRQRSHEVHVLPLKRNPDDGQLGSMSPELVYSKRSNGTRDIADRSQFLCDHSCPVEIIPDHF